MPTDTQPRGLLEVSCASELVGALEQLLTNPVIDTVVYRNMVSSVAARVAMRGLYDEPVQKLLYDEAPVLNDVDRLANNYWTTEGYSDYSPESDRLVPVSISHGGIGLHTDYPTGQTYALSGPLTLSLCVEGIAHYETKKPRDKFVTDDGKLDIKRWGEWKIKADNGEARTKFLQREGDGVFFMNHPYQTLHGVRPIKGIFRTAALFEYIQIKQK